MPGVIKPKTASGGIHLGIDPGQAGAIVSLYLKQVETCLLSGTLREQWEFINNQSATAKRYNLNIFCVMEHVWARPGQSASGMWKFGKGVGSLEAFLIAAKIPHEFCAPQKWMNALSVSTRKKSETDAQWKNRLKAKAEQLFPNEKITKTTADALLIAYYNRAKHKGTL